MKSLELANYKYENGARMVPDESGYVREEYIDFLQRMKEAEDISWLDLERCEKDLPVFDEAAKNRMNIRDAIEAIAAGAPMKKAITRAGFPHWGAFSNHALCRAKCIKKLYQMARDERDRSRLELAEEALHERAVEGVDEPMINHLGQIVGTRKKYSDSLLQLQLKALNREKYGERQEEANQGLIVNVQMGLRDPVKPAEGVEELEPYKGLTEDVMLELTPDHLGTRAPMDQ